MIEFYICVDCISSIHNCTTLSTFASSLSLSVIAGDGIGFVYIIWCVCVCVCMYRISTELWSTRITHGENTWAIHVFFSFSVILFFSLSFQIVIGRYVFIFVIPCVSQSDSISPKRLIYCSSMKLIWFLCKFFVDSDY